MRAMVCSGVVLREGKAATARVAGVDVVVAAEVSLVRVTGMVDEDFAGFKLGTGVKRLVIDVSAMTRMTSFGVRQWLKAMDGLKSIEDLYLLGCPTFFVDQLNMVLNFGAGAQVLTVMAPYTCLSCGAESGEVVDVLAERASLAKGGGSEKECSRCGGKLELDETPESYFSFVPKYAATSVQPAVAQMLAQQGLYTAVDTTTEKPPRIIKLVHGSVTYFRIRGKIGATFRARPFLVGAEGEVVIDLAEVEVFDPDGQREWRRLVKTLSAQVPALTLVDVPPSFLTNAGDSVSLARNICVWSVLVPYACADCGRTSSASRELEGVAWPLRLAAQVCSTCGGKTKPLLTEELLVPLQKANATLPRATAKFVPQRAEVLSRALTDANVAQAGDNASASLSTNDTILGKYKIVRRLSAGGMAEVFLANQVGIGGFEKPVALKRIQRQMLENRHLAIDMFLNEAKIAGRLMHPNIVQVLDVGEVGGALYLAMEYVRGKDLREIVKRLRVRRALMPVGLACFIAHEVAQALHHAYWSTDIGGARLAVVHRDVSPHNIIIGYDGAVKLLDFGVAMSSVTEEQSKSMIVGKWQYMSPEHTTSQELDHRSDLFSLGIILYLLVTGRMPFTGDDPKAIVARIRSGLVRPVEELAPTVPPALAALVARLLSVSPDQRPQTGQEVGAALVAITRATGATFAGADLATFLATLFAEHTNLSDSHVKVTGSLEIARLGVGSGQTPANFDDSRSLAPSVQTASRITPTSFSVATIDRSVSLAMGRHTTMVDPPVMPVVPVAPARGPAETKPTVRYLVMAGMVAAIALLVYIVLRAR